MALLSVADALRTRAEHAVPLPAEDAAVSAAGLGRVLTDDLKALRTQPPADVSAMDGYAVRAADVTHASVRLKDDRRGRGRAGRLRRRSAPDQAARIFTGGVMPAGADAIVIQDFTKRDGDCVDIQGPTARGRHIRAEGLDFKAGDVMLSAGTPAHHARSCARCRMNHPLMPVHRRPKGRDVRDRRRTGAAGYAAAARADRLLEQFALARWHALKERRRRLSASSATGSTTRSRPSQRAREIGADILVTSGGASVGDYDLVQKAFTAEGMTSSSGDWRCGPDVRS